MDLAARRRKEKEKEKEKRKKRDCEHKPKTKSYAYIRPNQLCLIRPITAVSRSNLIKQMKTYDSAKRRNTRPYSVITIGRYPSKMEERGAEIIKDDLSLIHPRVDVDLFYLLCVRMCVSVEEWRGGGVGADVASPLPASAPSTDAAHTTMTPAEAQGGRDDPEEA